MGATGERRVALLGGTFDPVHIGHLVVAEAALELLGVDEVRLLVAGEPWQKRTGTPAEVRVELCELAVSGHPGVAVDTTEVERDGPTYTADTLKQLRDAEPGVAWTFLLGSDAAARLATWRHAEDLPTLARFVAVTRPGHAMPALPSWVSSLEVPAVEVSSTVLRGMVATGRSIRWLVPDAVRHRIDELDLYRRDRGDRD